MKTLSFITALSHEDVGNGWMCGVSFTINRFNSGIHQTGVWVDYRARVTLHSWLQIHTRNR
jgi:hypothetical protein